jgi:ubiquitin-protein ligase
MNFEHFPRKPPSVHFISEVYHPMVNPETGELDLGEEISKNWNYDLMKKSFSSNLVMSLIQKKLLKQKNKKFLKNYLRINRLKTNLNLKSQL